MKTKSRYLCIKLNDDGGPFVNSCNYYDISTFQDCQMALEYAKSMCSDDSPQWGVFKLTHIACQQIITAELPDEL